MTGLSAASTSRYRLERAAAEYDSRDILAEKQKARSLA